ncbi:hypothetical protein GLAREA_06103 [Glarea lozoyensis ATCC 20868]|uniref:Uncharacterized protein n=1 Tax=Glarea lozoyensis (strain ATCC 20868 / MF5171) TaxID=1116229 RepID=S3DLZ7_GLAL2|nr:uncharacterized protein GLAREA_06103 [Glarea lozoyensis ATCC 20868]EPE33091.1 hypothetical protein GLAREA_06103 [Glarea lozoyensis ATCC 20868]
MYLNAGFMLGVFSVALGAPLFTTNSPSVINGLEKRQPNGFPFTLLASVIASLTDGAAIALLGAPKVAGGPADPLAFLQNLLGQKDANKKRQIFDDITNPTALVSQVTAAATDGVALSVLGAKPVAGGGSNLLNLLPNTNGELIPLGLLDVLAARHAVTKQPTMSSFVTPHAETFIDISYPISHADHDDFPISKRAVSMNVVHPRQLSQLPTLLDGLSSELTDPLANVINQSL